MDKENKLTLFLTLIVASLFSFLLDTILIKVGYDHSISKMFNLSQLEYSQSMGLVVLVSVLRGKTVSHEQK